MSKTSTLFLPDSAIRQINSLGGPPLPTGVSTQTLKVIMENRAASTTALFNCKMAVSLALKKL